MDSRLDSQFLSTIRRTESADARLGIRKDDPRDQNNKKNDGHEKDEAPATWEDSTIVSVQALRTFLESLLAPPPAPVASSLTQDLEPLRPAQQNAASAARAYQSTAHKSSAAIKTPESLQPAEKTAANPALSPADLGIIHALIKDLEFLSTRQVEHLQILKSDSFLQSLADAAARAKKSL